MSFADRAKAKAKQAAGEVIGDEQMKREGLAEERQAKQASEGRPEMATEGPSRGVSGGALGGAGAAGGAAGAQSESPVSNTVHNLVQTLSVKLDSAHRYGLYQEDAMRDGHEDCAQVFADIATRERETIDRLLQCLEERLGDRMSAGASAATTVGGASGVGGGLGHEATPGLGATEEPPRPGAGAGATSTDPLAGSRSEAPPPGPGDVRTDPRGPQSPGGL